MGRVKFSSGEDKATGLRLMLNKTKMNDIHWYHLELNIWTFYKWNLSATWLPIIFATYVSYQECEEFWQLNRCWFIRDKAQILYSEGCYLL